MKVVLLAGGFGTRIRDVADDTPKAMIPIGGHPIIWHIMKHYAHHGFHEFIVCLGYKGACIKEYFLNYETNTGDFTLTLGKKDAIVFHGRNQEEDWEITFAETGLNALTGARVKRIEKYIGKDENFMLTYGDGVGDVDIPALVRFHLSHGKTLTVTGVRPPGRFGELGAEDDGVVTQFNEKPQASGGRISGGFFVCKRDIFEVLSDSESLVFEFEPMQNLVAERQLAMYKHDGFWQPMDTPRDYRLLNDLCKGGTAPWMTWRGAADDRTSTH